MASVWKNWLLQRICLILLNKRVKIGRITQLLVLNLGKEFFWNWQVSLCTHAWKKCKINLKTASCSTWATSACSKFWGCQGPRTGLGVTTVSNSLILGGWVTKVLKNGEEKWGGGGQKGGWQQYLDFFMLLARQKNATLKNCVWGNFPIRICKVS